MGDSDERLHAIADRLAVQLCGAELGHDVMHVASGRRHACAARELHDDARRRAVLRRCGEGARLFYADAGADWASILANGRNVSAIAKAPSPTAHEPI